MDFLNNIENDSLLIIPNSMKDDVLMYIDSLDHLLNVKILSFNELKKELLFDIKDESILYLLNNYDNKKSILEAYLRNIYYVEDKSYNNSNLNKLVKIKKELEENNLLVHDDLLINHYKNKKVYVYGYDYIDSFNNRLLSNFNNVEIIDIKPIRDNIKVNSLNTLEDEISYLIENITKLIDKNIPLNKIVIVNTDDTYKKELYKYFNMSSIPIEIYKSNNISSSIIGKKVLNILKNNKSLDETLSYIEENYNLENDYNNKLYSKILSIFNRYNPYINKYDFNIIYECIFDDFNNEKLIMNKINGIRVEDYSNRVFSKDEYVFFVNFTEGNVPKIHKDEDYITDNMKEELNLDKTYIVNKYEKDSLINKILSTDNIYISYKLKYKDEEFYKSSLIDDNIFIDNPYEIDGNTLYSKTYTKLLLSSKLDDLIKYGKHNEYLDKLYNTVSINYREFDNKYKPINKENIKEYLNNKHDNLIPLSYSDMNTFYNCSFRYYLNRILEIDSFESNIYTFVGNLFHHVLSKMHNDDFDFDIEWNNYLKYKELSPKEEFFVNKLKNELLLIIDYIKEFDMDTGLVNNIHEERRKVEKHSELDFIFKGFIDKVMYKEYDGNTLYSVIDYKTGSPKIDFRDTYYGLSMQLPSYLYLIEKDKLFDNSKPVGLYLEEILSNEMNRDKDLSYKDIRFNTLKLNGYTTDDITNISRFDPTYDKSKYITSMSTTKEGLSKNAKVLTDEEYNELINLVDSKIDNMIDCIENAKFDINPVFISKDKSVTGCEYCKYKDICFRTNKDIKYVDKKENLSFLNEYK